MSPLFSSTSSQSTADDVFDRIRNCSGLASMMQSYIVGISMNEDSVENLLSGLAVLRIMLEDLQTKFDPQIGLLASREGVDHARN